MTVLKDKNTVCTYGFQFGIPSLSTAKYKEIAKAMHCSIGTVMSRLFYARRRLGGLLISLKKERRG